MKTPRWMTTLGASLALAVSIAGPAAAQDDTGPDPLGAAAGTGRVILTEPTDPEATVVDGIAQMRGATFLGATLEASDPRLAGTLSIFGNVDIHDGALDGAADFVIEVDTLRVVNDGGSWEGSTTTVGRSDEGLLPSTIILSGAGGYDGLTAYLLQKFDEAEAPAPVPFEGFIFPGEAPPTPQAAASE